MSVISIDLKKLPKKHWILTAVLTLCLVAFAGIVSGTFAFFRQDATAENYLYVKNLKVSLIDLFDGSGILLPGDTINKDVSMTNQGDVNAVVRIRLTPAWDPGQDIHTNTLDPQAVTVTMGPTLAMDWTLIDGWYYYNRILEPGETTSLLVDSLKLTAVSNDAHTGNYSQAEYTLGVESEALQAQPEATLDTWNRTYTTDTTDYIMWTTP